MQTNQKKKLMTLKKSSRRKKKIRLERMKVNTNKLQDFIDFAPTLRNDDMSEV
jgi:hypothetical protein